MQTFGRAHAHIAGFLLTGDLKWQNSESMFPWFNHKQSLIKVQYAEKKKNVIILTLNAKCAYMNYKNYFKLVRFTLKWLSFT